MQVSKTSSLRYTVEGGEALTGAQLFVPGDSIAKITRSHGIVFTSPFLLGTASEAIDSFGTALAACIDGTHKIHDNNWVLLPYGHNGLRLSGGKLVRSFRPWSFLFTTTENALAVSHQLSSTKEAVWKLFHKRLDPSVSDWLCWSPRGGRVQCKYM
jgi:hypothetical protein